jgi:thioredoxin-dependent peroxiredoxin
MKSSATVLAVIAMSSILNLFFPWLARAEMLKAGDLAPEFATDAIQNGVATPIKLSDYRGRKVVLYFYPKDNTPGCTKEACAFRDGFSKLESWGIVVLGCSIDSADAHRAFAAKYRLPFALITDPDNKIAKAYGADNGIPILGLDRRITYVISEDGRIVKVYPSVDPATHANEIIHDLGADKPAPSPTPVAAPPAPAAGSSPSGGGSDSDNGPD